MPYHGPPKNQSLFLPGSTDDPNNDIYMDSTEIQDESRKSFNGGHGDHGSDDDYCGDFEGGNADDHFNPYNEECYNLAAHDQDFEEDDGMTGAPQPDCKCIPFVSHNNNR